MKKRVEAAGLMPLFYTFFGALTTRSPLDRPAVNFFYFSSFFMASIKQNLICITSAFTAAWSLGMEQPLIDGVRWPPPRWPGAANEPTAIEGVAFIPLGGGKTCHIRVARMEPGQLRQYSAYKRICQLLAGVGFEPTTSRL
jgi:hypothetical protein